MKTLKLSYFLDAHFLCSSKIYVPPLLYHCTFLFCCCLEATHTHTRNSLFLKEVVFYLYMQVFLLAMCLMEHCLVKLRTGSLSQKSQFGLQGATPGLAGSTVLSL